MILYLDTSAFVPLLVAEATSASCREFWEMADEMVSTRLLYIEASAALAQAERLDRIDRSERAAAMGLLEGYWPTVNVIEVDERVMLRASVLAHSHKLRGYDAVHCASAELLSGDELLAVTSDRALRAAWSRLGLATAVPASVDS